jgi:hypothetical protein
MAVYQFRIGPYARSIYLYGTTTFAAIPQEYHYPVKDYVARNFTVGQIQEAFNRGYITQQEYDETMIIVGDDPFILPMLSPKEQV